MMTAAAPDITLVERFVPAPDALFATLRDSIVWEERFQARKTASFGRAYNYSGITYAEVPLPNSLLTLVEDLETHLGFRPNNCLMNYYSDGGSTMGFHADSTKELASGTGVAIVSLGAERSLTFRRITDRQHFVEFLLPNGSLLYMPPEVQTEWHHGVRKQENAGGRISLTFRALG